MFFNGGDCDVADGNDNPFTNKWKFDFPTPPGGTWFDIWISVYWHCHGDPNSLTCSIGCTSEDIYYRGYVHQLLYSNKLAQPDLLFSDVL